MKIDNRLTEFVTRLNQTEFLNSFWFFEIENVNFSILYRSSMHSYKVMYKSAFSNEALLKDSMTYDRFRDIVGKIFTQNGVVEHHHDHEPL